jgi:hypothetical protein
VLLLLRHLRPLAQRLLLLLLLLLTPSVATQSLQTML